MQLSKMTLSFFYLLVFSLSISKNLYAQNYEKKVVKPLNEYLDSPREVVYVHLNKSVYVKNESIGFTAYVLDKGTKQLNLNTRNLYCIIKDVNDSIVKKQLLLVKNGIASNVMQVDDNFKSGTYSFIAYTNYMRNFEEPNFFAQEISIIDPSTQAQETVSENSEAELFVQTFPEGGHLVEGLNNTLGITVKNQFGNGIKEIEGIVVNSTNDTITNFKLNHLGIGKFNLIPEQNDTYKVIFNYGYKNYTHKIVKADPYGLTLACLPVREKVLVNIQSRLNSTNDSPYLLVLHNGAQQESWEFSFEANSTELTKSFNKSDLLPGVNIFTIFNKEYKPIAQRKYFNFEGLKVASQPKTSVITKGDSIKIYVEYSESKKDILNNLSISVLPKQTNSYNLQDNIITKSFLKPYVRGFIEDASYYFRDIDSKKEYDLDLLMLTQGWSRYEWHKVLSFSPKLPFEFENGISFKATRLNRTKSNLFVQPLALSKSFYLDLDENDQSFDGKALFPVGNDQLKISEIKPNGKINKPTLYASFEPNHVADFKINETEKEDFKLRKIQTVLFESSDVIYNLSDIQELDEVEINADVERTRYEKIKRDTRGILDIFDDEKRVAYADFATYIASKGFIVNQNLARTSSGGANVPLLSIYNPRRTSLGSALQSPLIFLDGVLLSDLSILYNYKMDIVDYIEIDKSGSSMGMRGANGVIRIVTDPKKTLKQKTFNSVQIIDFPLKFEEDKTYYAPLYGNYNSDFYNKYGAIAWFPNITEKSNNNFIVTLQTPKIDNYKILIEGILEGRILVSSEKEL